MANIRTRQPTATEQPIIDDILKLYQLHPSEQAYSHYRKDAIFSDPVSIAQGLESIKSQFNGMPKIFSQSDTKSCNVIDDGKPSTLALDLTQHYVFKAGGKEKTLNSKVTLTLDGEGRVTRHDEEWEHQPNATAKDGFMGQLQEGRKKAGAKLVEASVSSDPKDI